MNRVFVLGNGQSRLGIDLNELRKHGKIYGCNALYRDFTPDVLIGVDQGIMHEIYHSGYCEKNTTYFRNWSKVPIELLDNMIKAGASDEDVRLAKEEGAFYENERPKDCKEFVMHGSSVAGVAHVVRSDKTKGKRFVQQKSIKISYLKPGNKSQCINDVMPEPGKDKGWAAGPTATFLACLLEEPDEVYLLGMDLNSTTGKVNNIYAGTPNYVLKDHAPTPSVNWITQLKETFFEFSGKSKYKRVMFYKVQNNIKAGDDVNKVCREWTDHKGNLDYIDFGKFYDMIQH